MGCAPDAIRGLLSGTTVIDERMAAALAGALGGSPAFWHRRQDSYERSLSRAAEAIPAERVASWLRQIPVSDMASAGWIPEARNRGERLRSCMAYFGVANPDEWERRYATFSGYVAFRTSPSFESKRGALSAWLRQAEIEATMMPCAPWNRASLEGRLDELRVLTKAKNPSYFLPHLREICASAGVAAVVLRAPSGCRASGAARFIARSLAMIVLSFRYLSEDHFWFTVFHEIGHLLLHGRSNTFVDDDALSTDDREVAANRFAASTLVPPSRFQEMQNLRPTRDAVVRFAVSLGISPGIVVGQMQHDGLIGPDQLNYLKRRYTWNEISAAIA
jgi:hypothetical protein